jgi:GH18 family chitinase
LRESGRALSAAVIAEGHEHGAFIHREVFDAIDQLNIMAYDWHYQVEGRNHSPYALAESSLNYWLGRGCAPQKAVLGVPFYGRTATTSAAYREILARDPDAAQRDGSEGILYNGIPTIRKKTELALEKAGGIMFWELTQDALGADSLLSAIHATVTKSTKGA